jgi:hypothetical protein
LRISPSFSTKTPTFPIFIIAFAKLLTNLSPFEAKLDKKSICKFIPLINLHYTSLKKNLLVKFIISTTKEVFWSKKAAPLIFQLHNLTSLVSKPGSKAGSIVGSGFPVKLDNLSAKKLQRAWLNNI